MGVPGMTTISIRNRSRERVLFQADCGWEATCIETAVRGKVDLAGADLKGWNLVGAEIQGARMRGASMIGANLMAVNACGADLSECLLVGANLCNAALMGASLVGSDLSGINLVGANLSAADLRGAKMINANLTGAKFGSADLTGADLTNANLIDAEMVGVVGRSCVVTGFLPWPLTLSCEKRVGKVGCKEFDVLGWRGITEKQAEAWKPGGGAFVARREPLIALAEAFWDLEGVA